MAGRSMTEAEQSDAMASGPDPEDRDLDEAGARPRQL